MNNIFNASLIKKHIKWKRVVESKKNFIAKTLNLNKVNKIYSYNDKSIFGFYLLFINKKKIFLKIIDKKFFENQHNCLILEKWLFKKGLNVSFTNIRDKKLKIHNGYLCVYTNYLEDKNYKYINEKLFFAKLGREVAKLHNNLRIYTKEKKYKKNTINFYSKLKKKFLQIKKDVNLNDKQKKIFKEDINFDKLMNNPQLTHGDLNIGNIIINKNKIHFIDFELCFISYLNPISEIVYIIERFTTYNSKKKTLEMSKIFLKNYIKNVDFKIEKFDISEYLKILNLRALLILKVKKITNRREEMKFENLFFKSERYKNTYSKIINYIYD